MVNRRQLRGRQSRTYWLWSFHGSVAQGAVRRSCAEGYGIGNNDVHFPDGAPRLSHLVSSEVMEQLAVP